MPATFSAIGAAGAAVVPEVPVDPGEAAEGASGAAACPAALPHFGQNAALSAIWVPQAEQNAIRSSSAVREQTDFRFAANNNRVGMGTQNKNGSLAECHTKMKLIVCGW